MEEVKKYLEFCKKYRLNKNDFKSLKKYNYFKKYLNNKTV